MYRRRLSSALALVLLLLAVALAASQGLAKRSSVFSQLDLLVDIRHEIVREYVEEPDADKLIESAVRAMVEALDDPYTVYLAPQELEPFDKQVRGTFSGIGAEVDLDEKEKRLRIVSPLEESPAWKAGVMAGDIVLEIDGVSTTGMSLPDAISRLTGEEGTDVTIKVRHLSGEEAVITITRARINVQTVRGIRRGPDHHWDYLLDPARGIGYIRLTQFTENTPKDLRTALEKLRDAGARGLILDLRFNPGGLLDAAVKVSDMFLPEGCRIVSVKGRTVPERVSSATVEGVAETIPLVVLANEASASASEIVTGALADNDRAVFIGTRTFGKGSVQTVKMLEGGRGAIKITHAYYYLPSGRNIHRRPNSEVWGVDPNDGFYVAMTPEQVRRMLQVRREGDVLREDNGRSPSQAVSPEWIRSQLSDPQLAAGLEALLGKLDSGQWPRVGQSGAEELARQARRDTLIRQRESLQERLDQINQQLARIDAGEDTGQPAPAESKDPAAP